MDKELGIFVTTHLNPGYRHGTSMEANMFNKFKDLINNFQSISAGVTNDLVICDTGSTITGYNEWIKENNLNKINIPNNGGCFAAMKYLMHTNPNLINNYQYLLFTVDDEDHRPTIENWAVDLIKEHNSKKNIGLLGRFLDTIKLGPTGLVDHRNCCPHIAKIWGIKENALVMHMHANWFFMTKEILLDLAKVWYDPVCSVEGMEYQKKYENEDFCKLANMDNKNRKVLDNIHIGRETDLALRLYHLLGKRAYSYMGTAFYPNAIEPYKQWVSYNCKIDRFYGEYKYEDS